MLSLVAADTPEAILPRYRGTPIELLLRYHNLGAPLPDSSGHAQLLISMCMDYRKELVVPAEFAYVLRSAGGSLRDSEFEVSYAVAFVTGEARRLRSLYPRIQVAPLMYRVEDDRLVQVLEEEAGLSTQTADT